MASYIVTIIADENDAGASVDTPLGDGLSLREAITLANANAGADTITFADGFGEAFENGGTIYLTQGTQLETTGDVTIDGDVDGDGKGDVTVDANSAEGQDDAASRVLLVGGGTTKIDGLTITGGEASVGGGIHVGSGAALELTNSTVSGNDADDYGGGLLNDGTATLTNSTVSGNSADLAGGGLYNRGGATTLTSSTVSGNSASQGGGLWITAGTTTLTNSTVSGNDAGLFGGGLYNYTGAVTLANSIVLGNSGSSDPEVRGAHTNTGNLSIVGGHAVGDVFAAIDPLTGGGLLADNNGPVATIALKVDASNPALDAGDDAAAPAADARGVARFDADGVANNGADISDLGAYEFAVGTPEIDLNGAAGGKDTTLAFTENGALVEIAPDATVIDLDSPNLDTGTLTVAFAAPVDPDDLLRIVPGKGFTVEEAGEIFYDDGGGPVQIGTAVGGNGGSDSLVITFTNLATPAIVQELVRAIGFVNFSFDPVGGDRTLIFTLTDGDGETSNTANAVVTVTTEEDPAIALDDQVVASEDFPLEGNVFADNGNGEDVDPDGPPFQVIEVNGSPTDVGQTITLASGATLRLNADGTFTYDPNGQFEDLPFPGSDTDSFTYMITGGSTATVTVTINAEDDPAVIAPEGAEDTSVTEAGGVANGTPGDPNAGGDLGVTDPEGTVVDFQPALDLVGDYGTFTFTAATGVWTYVLDDSKAATQGIKAGEVAHDTMVVQATDGTPYTIDVSVNGSNDVPTAPSSNSVFTNEDTPATVAIGANDVDGDVLLYSIKPGFAPALGSVSFAGGNFTYTPSANVNGSDAFTIVISDGKGGSIEQAVSVAITAVPDAPVAGDDSFIVAEDGVLAVPAGSLTGNDVDGDGDPLTITGVANPANGTVVLNGDGSITFTPDANFNGVTGFDYTITDGSTSDTGHVTVDVTPVNDPPTAPSTNSVTTMEDTASAAIAIGASDIDGGPLNYTIRSFDAPAKGTVSFAGGAFTYTPFANANGADAFIISIDDGKFGFTEQKVTVTITPVNDPPIAVDDARNADQDQTAEYTAASLTANDTDVDGDALRITAVSNPQNGTVSLPANRVVFTPTPGFTGTAGFDYTITDDKGGTDTGHVTVTVAPAEETNEDPEVDPEQSLATPEDTPLLLTVEASDADGDPLAYAASDPAHGTVTGGADGKFTYTPDEGFLGTDSFIVTVTDGEGGSAEQTVEVAVVELPAAGEWRLIASTGFAGEVGGSGQVIGTQGFQAIEILDLPGTIAFDPSTNQGGDLITLPASASAWNVVRMGSSALMSDGDTFVLVPAGIEETFLAFADGVRPLSFDPGEGAIMLGAQEVTDTLSPVTAAPDGPPPADEGDPEALARLFLGEAASVAAGGRIDAIGTNGEEELTVTRGKVNLDPSFNGGGDVLVLDEEVESFTAVQLGSSVLLEGSGSEVLIPVGTEGMTLAFADGERTLVYDAGLEAILIGTQTITATPIPLSDFA